MKNLPIYNITLGEAEGIQVMSIVKNPAVECNFLAFNKEEQKMNFSVNEEQHIVFGVALRADYPIYRYNDRLGEYYVVFNKETIKQLYEKFMIDGSVLNVNLNHDKMTNGVTLIQSFIKDTEKGINPVGFEDIADGSWFTAYKINNKEVWESVKQGKFNGFSVEGQFELSSEVFNEESDVDEMDEFIDSYLN